MTEAVTNPLAEIIGAVVESITALSEVSAIRHNTHLLRHCRDEAALDEGLAAFFETERQKSEEDLLRANADLRQSLRKLEAMKLVLEGKTREEIRAKFAEEDEAVTAFIDKIRPEHESGMAFAPAER
jgi:hypothetical protein